MGVAFVSRVAKNFQDYFVNVVTQRVGADLYSDGIKHSLELPYSLFEDQRSGETLGKIQKARADAQIFVTSSVNLVFTTLVGVVFVMIYAYKVYWAIAPAFLLTVPLLGVLSSVLSRRIKTRSESHRGRDDRARRRDYRVAAQHRAREEPRAHRPGSARGSTRTTEKILKLELKKVRYLRSLSFIQGTAVNFLRTCILFLMLYLIFAQQITVGQFFSLLIYSFFIFGPLQELGNVINTFRETEASMANLETMFATPVDPKPANPVEIAQLATLTFDERELPAPLRVDAGADRHHVRYRARRDHRVRGALGRWQVDAREAAARPVSTAVGRDPLQRRAER